MSNSLSPISGIYIIVNKKSCKMYIGQTQNIQKRWRQHKVDLRGGYHINRHLQSAWDKYGEKAFKFQVLEYCPIDQLDEREQHFLNIYIPKGQCYNVATDVIAPGRGRKVSPETSSKKVATRRANGGYVFSEDTRQKLREANTGHVHSEEHKEKISIARRRKYILTSPDGIEYEVSGLKQFCEGKELNRRAFSRVATGERKHYKGWKCRYA